MVVVKRRRRKPCGLKGWLIVIVVPTTLVSVGVFLVYQSLASLEQLQSTTTREQQQARLRTNRERKTGWQRKEQILQQDNDLESDGGEKSPLHQQELHQQEEEARNRRHNNEKLQPPQKPEDSALHKPIVVDKEALVPTVDIVVETDPYILDPKIEKAMAQPFPRMQWQKCLQQNETFHQRCRPTNVDKDTCYEQVQKDFAAGKHGIGNALMVQYVKQAKRVYESGCVPILNMSVTEDALLNFFQVPPYMIPESHASDDHCIMYSILQPLPDLQKDVEQLLNDNHVVREGNDMKPLVGIHIRTGWADEIYRGHWDGLGDCHEYHDEILQAYPQGPAGILTVDDGFNLEGMVKDFGMSADQAFGEGQWMAYVASDSPGAKDYVRATLIANHPGVHVFQWNRLIQHNAVGGNGRKEHQTNQEAKKSAMIDLIMMSYSSLFFHSSSKYPRAAWARSPCPTMRTHQYSGHPRHVLCDFGDALAGKDAVPLEQLDELTKFWKRRDKVPCFKNANPGRACSCYYKMAHSGELPIPGLVK